MLEKKKELFLNLTQEEKDKLPILYHTLRPAEIDTQIYFTQINRVQGASDILKGYYKLISRII